MKKTLYLFLLILVISSSIYATDVRALGMGGAFIAVADDVGAIFYNPAGMTQIKKISLKVNANVGLEDEENYQNVIEYFKEGNKLKETFELMGINTDFTATAGGSAGFATNRFGFTFQPTYVVSADKSKSQVNVDQINTSHIAFALPLISFFENVSVGTNIKLYQASKEEYLLLAGNTGIKQNSLSGQGVGLDFGLLANFGMLSTGLSIKDLYSQIVWEPEDGSSYTSKIDPYLNFGVALRLPKAGFTAALDYTDLYLNKSFDSGKLRIGLEQKLLWLLDLRGGATFSKDEIGNEKTDLSAGLGFNFGPVKADVAVMSSDYFQKTAAFNLAVGVQF